MSTINLLSRLQPPTAFALNPLEAAKGFASDIVKRTGLGKGLDAPSVQSSELSEDLAKRVTDMEKSLESTIRYLTQHHGKGAATAAMGIIYKTVGEGTITEQTLSDAFLDVTRFIDTQFGFAQGDNFIHHLNNDLNKSINELFQNGETEIFIAVTTVDGQTYSTADSASSNIILKSLSQAISDGLTDVDEFTEKILKDMQEKRPAPEQETALTPYVTPSPLPSGSMIERSV